MLRRPIHDEVMGLALASCTGMPSTSCAAASARAGTVCASDVSMRTFWSLFWVERPRIDDDAFNVLAMRRAQVADHIAHANLQAYEQEAPAGLYLAIPFLLRCSDKQPVWVAEPY